MLIWLLALVLLASEAGLGYRQGAIRVGISFFGIVVGALLAPLLGKLAKPLLTAFGMTNPVLIWLLGPLIVFVVVSVLFKAAALPLHQKVDVYYRYKTGELRPVLWDRLNRRLGSCLGLLNATAYLVLISVVIYIPSYWTVQLATPDQDPAWIKWLNRLGQGLQSSGFAKVARVLERMPRDWYDAADLAGVIYHNPLSEARLSRYPAFLGLAEMPEFKSLGGKEFADLRQRGAPLMELLHYHVIDGMLANPDTLRLVWNTVEPDMADLRAFLATGQSAKYDSETILGRWKFDVTAAVNVRRRLKPNMPAKELQVVRHNIATGFEKTSLVAMADHRMLIKNLPPVRLLLATAPATAPVVQNLDGKWTNQGGKYQLSMSSSGGAQDFAGTVNGDRLTIDAGEGMTLIFARED